MPFQSNEIVAEFDFSKKRESWKGSCQVDLGKLMRLQQYSIMLGIFGRGFDKRTVRVRRNRSSGSIKHKNVLNNRFMPAPDKGGLSQKYVVILLCLLDLR